MGKEAGISDRDQLARVALKWVLSHPEVTTVVVGAHTPEQLANSVAVLDDPALASEEQEMVERIKATPTYRSYAQGKRAQFGY
jgi:aryl-alcohol dehydrogenase-like predicted oxidoreductase